MKRNLSTHVPKVWTRFSIKKCNGAIENFRITDLPKDRVDDYVDFKIKHFVKQEVTHQIAGIPESSEALDEYRGIWRSMVQNPSYHSIVCCSDNCSKPDILGATTLKLTRKSDQSNGNIQDLKTTEVKRFFEILHNWNNLYPVSDLMEKYNMEKIYEDMGMSVHSDYNSYGIGSQLGLAWGKMRIAQGASMVGAWGTSLASQKFARNLGFEEFFAIHKEEISKILNVRFPKNTPSTFIYFVVR